MRSFSSQAAPGAEKPTVITAPELASFSFELDEVGFTCAMRTDADAVVEWSEFAAAALDDVDSESPEGVALVSKLLRLAMPNGEYRRFRSHMRREQTPPDVLMEVLQYINEQMEAAVSARTARPTGQPSPSSRGGAGQGGRVQKVISLGKGDVQVVPLPPTSDHLPKQDRPKGGQRKRAASAS